MSKKDSKKGETAQVNVVIRIRPLNGLEKRTGQVMAWGYRQNQVYLTAKPKSQRTKVSKFSDTFFTVDRVYPPSTTNEQIFEGVGMKMLDGVMNGFHGCIFAYGQTSSGKTFSIHGSQKHPGMVPQSIQYIFDYIQDHPGREYVLRVSYLEIYNEIINDLLNPSGTRLRIRESKQKGVFVDGLKEEVVMSCQQVLALIAAGESHRHIGRTNYNEVSSRSHTLFRVVVESSGKAKPGSKRKNRILTSTLNIVDLAGSENAVKAGSTKRIKETGYINKSLLTLGHVIFKLSEKGKGHIPYRNSKLTRVLQNSLSGRALVAIVCCMSPATSNIEETAQTLKFATRAKKIKNTVSANEKLDDATLLEKYREEIGQLKKDLLEAKKKAAEDQKNKVDKEELTKAQENIEDYKQRLEKLKRLILTSNKPPEQIVAAARRGSILGKGGDKMSSLRKKAKSFTLPRHFFMPDEAPDDIVNPMENPLGTSAPSSPPDTNHLKTPSADDFDFKPQFDSDDKVRKASADFAEMQRTIEDLKQKVQNKDGQLRKAMEEIKRLQREIVKRDTALREWEAFYQAQSNKEKAQEGRSVSPKSPKKSRRSSDLLESADADFDSPLVSY